MRNLGYLIRRPSTKVAAVIDRALMRGHSEGRAENGFVIGHFHTHHHRIHFDTRTKRTERLRTGLEREKR